MATPDSIMITQGFNKVRATVEVRGDWVFVDMVTRFGEPLLSLHLSADEADALAGKLLDAVAVIDNRNAAVTGASEADFDAALAAVTETVPNPTFSQATPADVSTWADPLPPPSTGSVPAYTASA
jgi:hypothetical protein